MSDAAISKLENSNTKATKRQGKISSLKHQRTKLIKELLPLTIQSCRQQILSIKGSRNGYTIRKEIDNSKKKGHHVFKDLLGVAASALYLDYVQAESKILEDGWPRCGYLVASASRTCYLQFHFKRPGEHDNACTKIVKVHRDPSKEENFPKVGLVSKSGVFFECPLISDFLYNVGYVALASRVEGGQEFIWINGSMLDSLQVDHEEWFVESANHCDVETPERHETLPGSSCTLIATIDGETPLDLGLSPCTIKWLEKMEPSLYQRPLKQATPL